MGIVDPSTEGFRVIERPTINKVGKLARSMVGGGRDDGSQGRAAIYAYIAAGVALLSYLSLLRDQRGDRGKGEWTQAFALGLGSHGEATFELLSELYAEHRVNSGQVC